ncbi:MAG: SMC-Scp complex subunit ScpB [Candidatus Kapabacteria bacterium]|nr:SMC-Scp complex subunit ScpB [Candidatus Kapabacteria bacterium]MDW8012855.1 SMC-Scp complex subunit ScpB [Bacteroidota bacterium]
MRSSSLEVPLKRVVEALLFAAESPVEVCELALRVCAACGLPAGSVGEQELERAIAELNAELEETGRPYRVQRLGESYGLVATPEASWWIERAFSGRARRRLSQAALEVLAIVAYRQPITRAEIDTIRGVNSGDVLQSLVDRGLLTVVGHAAAPGRPALYGTTPQFLHLFGLASLHELPPLEEVERLVELPLFEPIQGEVLEARLRQLRLPEEGADAPGAL